MKTVETREPLILNPSTHSPQQMQSESSGFYSNKRKPYLQKQASELDDAYGNEPTKPTLINKHKKEAKDYGL